MIRIVLVLVLAAALALQGNGGSHPYQPMEDVRVLAADDMEGRAPDTPGSARARAYILRRFAEAGLAPAIDGGFEQPFGFSARGRERRGVNIVGRIEGSQPGDRAMVILAHYDHDGIRGGQIYNGADDNASGVAGLLAAAEAFRTAPPRHDVVFAAVDAEELGLHGSSHLAANMPGGLDRVVLAVNLDMLSKNDRGELYVAGTSHFSFLKPRMEAVAGAAPLKLLLGHDRPIPTPAEDWTNQSDHFSFHQKGVPWLYFGVENHTEYHTPRDDYETVPEAFFRASVETVIAAIKALDADLDAIAQEAGR